MQEGDGESFVDMRQDGRMTLPVEGSARVVIGSVPLAKMPASQRELSVQTAPQGDAWITRLQLNAPMTGRVKLALFDITGRQVRELWHGPVSSGSIEVTWSGTDDQGLLLPSGIYFIRAQAGGRTLHRRVLVLRR